MNKLGVAVLGLASAAAGVLDLVWGEFEPAHQPIQAFGDHIPGVAVLAYVTAVGLIVGGLATLWRRTARWGAVALAIIYFAFAIFWLPRFFTAPRVLGYHASIYIGVAGGMLSQLIVVAGAAIVLGSSATPVARWIFGVGAIDFGLAHLTDVKTTARLIQKWMPLGGDFWTIVSGVCFVLAGLAILSGIFDVLAARLLAVMLLLFSVLVLVPLIVSFPHRHTAWGGNAYDLAAVGAILIFADSIASRQPSVSRNAQRAQVA